MLSVFSHRFHRFTQKLGCLQGGALVPSVGVTLLLRRQDTSATIFRTQRICVNLCNLWEALLSSRFCEFRAICGRTAACSVGALETSAPPENASVPSVGGSPQQQVLCKSVKSVGEYTHPNFCGFRGFRGRHSPARLR